LIKGGLLGKVLERVPRDARRTAWRWTARARRAVTTPTSALRVTPDYLIAGGQRCGTTSLQQYLIQHPGITPPGVLKGIHYFDTNYDEGFDWYRGHFPTRLARSLKERRGGTLLTGEASPYYMFHPLVPERIGKELPDAKVIVLVRDPADRAYSHYLHEVRRGFEDLSFEDALDHEAERIDGEEEKMRRDPSYVSFEHQHHTYLARGRYIEQIERIVKHLGHDRLLVIGSEDFFRESKRTYHEVLTFLGLPEFTPGDFEAQNANVYRDPLSPELRARLDDHFADSNRRLFEFAGRDFGWA
jgi:hypothetical protein